MTTLEHTTGLAARRGLTLGDFLLPATFAARAPGWARDVILVAAGTALLIVGGYLSFTPPPVQVGQGFVIINEYVPITLQTFGVLFTAALLGTRRGISAVGLYLLIGLVGFPVFSADAQGVHRSGLETFVATDGGRLVMGTTGGYLLGFLVAAAIVGGLAERGWDRHIGGSIGAMLIGSVIIYALGVTWLAMAASLDINQALSFGLWPFLLGDVVKLLLAAGLLPLGWRMVRRRASEGGQRPDLDR